MYEHWYIRMYVGTQVRMYTVPAENWLFLGQLSRCRTRYPDLRQPTAGPLQSQRSWQQSRAQLHTREAESKSKQKSTKVNRK